MASPLLNLASDLVAFGSAAVAVPLVAGRSLRPEPGGTATGACAGVLAPSGVLWHPRSSLLATAALRFAHQVAVNANLLAARGGDPGFVFRYEAIAPSTRGEP